MCTKNVHKTGIFIALVGLVACSTTGVKTQPIPTEPEQDQLARYEAMKTQEAVQEVENIYESAATGELAFLAPKHVSEAQKALQEAKSTLANQGPRDKVILKVAVADAVLKNGDVVRRNMKNILKPELEIKQNLEKLDAEEVFTGEYGSLLERLRQVIDKIESGRINDADKHRAGLIDDMMKLEIRTVRYRHLNEAEELMKRVKNLGGAEIAPITYREALKVFSTAEKFIESNHRNTDGVERVAQEALFAARRAWYITEEVAALNHKVSRSLEQLVLDEEYRLYRVSRAISHEDVRDNPLEVQSEMLAKSIASMNRKAKDQAKLLGMLKDKMAGAGTDLEKVLAMDEHIQQLQKEKNEWLAKEALLNAKLVEMQNAKQQVSEEVLTLEQDLASHQDKVSMLNEKLFALEQQLIEVQQKPVQNTASQADTVAPEQIVSMDSVQESTETTVQSDISKPEQVMADISE